MIGQHSTKTRSGRLAWSMLRRCDELAILMRLPIVSFGLHVSSAEVRLIGTLSSITVKTKIEDHDRSRLPMP